MAKPNPQALVDVFGRQVYQTPSSVWSSGCSNGSPQTSTPLSCVQSALLLVDQRLLTSLHDLLALRQNHLDVARVAHVGVDSTVSSVCSTSLFWGLVDLDVLDD
jgi:hypothetical protein